MHELAALPALAEKAGLNHTQAVEIAVAPAVSLYCNVKVCVSPEPLGGFTETELTASPGAITSHTPGPNGVHGPEDT